MKKQLFFALLVISFVLISGCIQQEKTQIGKAAKITDESKATVQETQETETLVLPKDALTETKGMGNLCSSLSGCFVFCKNNVGRCTNFCKENPSHELCKIPEAAKPREWIRDSITQPLPEGASKVRLVFFSPLDALHFRGIGGYGAHRGGHPEGLDHEWLPLKKGVVMTSWADGLVVWARPAPGDAGYDIGRMNVVVYYGDGLWGEHMGLDRNKVLVKEGQRVKAGDPIGYGQPDDVDPTYQLGEFTVADQHRRDGDRYWYTFVKGATLVSPFDYLKDDTKKQLEEKWQKEIIDTYLLKGEDVYGVAATPWEPYLTNPMLLHSGHKRELVAEWYLRSNPWEDDGAPDVLIFFAANTKYYNKQRVLGTEESTVRSVLTGDWEADYGKNQLVINTSNGVYYGIFEIDESEQQAKLKIEYQKDSYPGAFSEKALEYTERLKLSKSNERFYWKPENVQYIYVEDMLYNPD